MAAKPSIIWNIEYGETGDWESIPRADARTTGVHVGDHGAIRIGQINFRDPVDRWQALQVVPERRSRLDHVVVLLVGLL